MEREQEGRWRKERRKGGMSRHRKTHFSCLFIYSWSPGTRYAIWTVLSSFELGRRPLSVHDLWGVHWVPAACRHHPWAHGCSIGGCSCLAWQSTECSCWKTNGYDTISVHPVSNTILCWLHESEPRELGTPEGTGDLRPFASAVFAD